MKKQLQIVVPIFFEDNLILSLSKDWINLFEKIPEFSVRISKKKLVLESIPTIKEKKR